MNTEKTVLLYTPTPMMTKMGQVAGALEYSNVTELEEGMVGMDLKVSFVSSRGDRITCVGLPYIIRESKPAGTLSEA